MSGAGGEAAPEVLVIMSFAKMGRGAPSSLRLTLLSEAQVSLPSLKGGAGGGFTATVFANDTIPKILWRV